MLEKVASDYVIDKQGRQLPIVNWFNSDGEECEKQDAVVIVAGSDAAGYHVVDLRGLDPVTVN